MAGVFESERNDIVALGESLRWVDSREEPQSGELSGNFIDMSSTGSFWM